jgi:hypothetical protein
MPGSDVFNSRRDAQTSSSVALALSSDRQQQGVTDDLHCEMIVHSAAP